MDDVVVNSAASAERGSRRLGPLGFGRRLGGPLLSVQRLDGAGVVFAELHEGVPAPVEGRHDGLPHVRVGEPEAVAQLVGQGLQHVGAPVGGYGPVLGVVHVDVAAVLREVGVGEGAAGAVEGIAVTVLVLLEPGGEGNDAAAAAAADDAVGGL